MYTAAHGSANKAQIRRALGEFHRRVNAEESDVRVLVATGVPVQKFLRKLDVISQGAVFEILFDDHNGIDAGTKGEVYIIKFQGPAHQAAVSEIGRQLGNYGVAMNRSLKSGGGDVEMPRSVRSPDEGLRSRLHIAADGPVTKPRMIAEVEFKNRSLPAADKFCQEYFAGIDQLRAVLLLNFFSRRAETGDFTCLAVLYRRQGSCISIDNVVSFGTAPLSDKVHLPSGFRSRIHGLPLLTQQDIQNGNRTPWQQEQRRRTHIPVPSADLFYLDTTAAGQVRTIPQMPASPLLHDLEIDLFEILMCVESYSW